MVPEPILLVDDELEMRLSLSEGLALEGYQVETADSYEQAWAKLASTPYPVIVTDLHMPGGKSGMDLLDAVKGREPRPLCIVITGYATLDLAIQALKQGAYDFLKKPFRFEELVAVLNRALSHARLEQRLQDYQTHLEARVLARVAEMHRFQDEALKLNELLREALGAESEQRAFEPLLEHLQTHYEAQAVALYCAHGVDSWRRSAQVGQAVFPGPEKLSAPSSMVHTLEGWEGQGEGHFVPLRVGRTTVGAVAMAFQGRTAFATEDPLFQLACGQLVAVIHALERLRGAGVAG
ncbi:MAG: response regulator [Firmicutes bacterium]|nr:response regulator [Bacillota bacterium]